MRKIKEILRLRLLGGITGARRIGLAVGCGKTAVAECLRRAVAAGLTDWAAVEALDETALEQRLYPAKSGSRLPRQRPLPDWARVREEMARRDHQVTLALLWTEYKAEHPDGYQYSQFAELYRQYEKRLSVVLRQNHVPGERSFVDYCDGSAITDPVSGAEAPTGGEAERDRWLTPEEAARLIAACAPHLAAMVRFALATGCRAREIVHLEWKRVDLKRGTAWLDQTKNGTPRGVPLNRDALAVLEEQVGIHPRFCFTYRGQPIRYELTNTGWQSACAKAGLTDLRFHDLRHTWASWHRQVGTSCDELKDPGWLEVARHGRPLCEVRNRESRGCRNAYRVAHIASA